jgi:hypothetical protein
MAFLSATVESVPQEAPGERDQRIERVLVPERAERSADNSVLLAEKFPSSCQSAESLGLISTRIPIGLGCGRARRTNF